MPENLARPCLNIKSKVVAYTHNSSTWEVEAGVRGGTESGVQSHLHLHSTLEVSLSYMRPGNENKSEKSPGNPGQE